MSQGFRTFIPSKNTWDTTLYTPTPATFLQEWKSQISQAQAAYAALSISTRALFLQALAQEFLLHKSEINLLYCQESGLFQQRFEAEFERTYQTILLFAEHCKNFQWSKTERIENANLAFEKRFMPLGPVLVLGSSNFPLAYSTLGGDTIAALAAGCCVVIKAHPMHVGTSSLVANCITKTLQKFKLSLFTVSHVLDSGYFWAQTFVQEPYIQAVGFTGSIRGGRALMDLAAARQRPIPVFAEMGSINPVFIDLSKNGIELETVARQLAASINTDAGQFCTKPGMLFIHDTDLEKFVSLVQKELEALPVFLMLHPDIFAKYEARKQEVWSENKIRQISSSKETKGLEAKWGLAITNCQDLSAAPKALEEVFGPFAVICSYQDPTDCITVLEKIGGQLTGSVFIKHSTALNPLLHLQLQNQVGRLIINGVPTGVRVLDTMHHGGPYPASSDTRFTAVGPDSMLRFCKPLCIQVQQPIE
ncbi:MAG: hypothetical protein RLZZ65_1626 [Bacteroidota bacterium]|jgi:NADP-dependent aldehyde dehydrogenase